MELVIYTYGHIDAAFYVISGIAMIMNSQFADIMISAISIISASYYAIRAAYASSSGGAKFFLIRIFGMIIVINILLVPKTSITIKDYVTKKIDRVDNLPYGFAVPIGIIESFGNILSMAFEQSFRTVDNLDYRNYGMVFGARLIGEARAWRIKNPEFIFNMHNFIKRCIALDIGMMNKYGINDLFESEDIWSLIKSKTSNFRNVGIRRGNSHNLVSCKAAANEIFEEYFSSETEGLISRYTNSIYSLAGNNSEIFSPRSQENLKGFFKRNIELVFGDYVGKSYAAESQLKQYMMMNSLSDFARNYGFSRSSMNQESNWRISGDLAAYYLPILLSVMKNLIYASFVFIVPIMLLGSGFSKYLGYISIILSIQLWPSLNAILSLFLDLYSGSQIKDIAEGGITFASYSGVGDYADKIALVASGLQMIVPFLAFSIMQGGVSGFIHLANSISAASNNASNIASNEMTTGNKSFDNYSSGNTQIENRSGFKTDYNSSYKAAMQEWQNADGSISRKFADGSSILQSGMGLNISGGGAKFGLRKAASDQIAKDISNAKSMLATTTKSYREAEYDTFNKVSSLLGQIAQRDYYSKNIDYSKSKEYSDSLGYYVGKTKSIRKSTGESWEKSANMAIRMSAGGGAFGMGGSLEVGGSISKNFTDSHVKEEQITSDESRKRDYTRLVRATSSEQFSRSNNIDVSYSDDIRKSYEKQKTYEEQSNIQSENLKRYNEAFSKMKSAESSYEIDMYDELQKKLAKTFNISTKDAHNMIENMDPRIDDIWTEMVEKYKANFIPLDISAKQINPDDAQKDFETRNKSKIKKDVGMNFK